jgi:nucleotide-binding universal stress UspA family protein
VACYRNILVALDGSPDSYAALAHGATLSRDQNARLTVLSVIPPSAPGDAAISTDDLKHLHIGVLRAAVDSVPDDVSVTTLLESGNPAETIVQVAERADHDLVLMGSHGHSHGYRALLGSVSERVLRASAMPVLLMRSGTEAPVPVPAP